jgi:hypothetical protein
MPRPRHAWQPCAETDATHWRVECGHCPFKDTKESKRNVSLCQSGHMNHHQGLLPQYTVTPVRRVLVSVAAGGRRG